MNLYRAVFFPSIGRDFCSPFFPANLDERMFAGTGIFLKQTCPFIRSPTKSSANPQAAQSPAAGTPCGRPHCKQVMAWRNFLPRTRKTFHIFRYNHQIPEPPAPAVLPVQRSTNTDFPSLVPELEPVSRDKSPTRPRGNSLSTKETNSAGKSLHGDSITVRDDSPATTANLEHTAAALPRTGLLAFSAPGETDVLIARKKNCK